LKNGGKKKGRGGEAGHLHQEKGLEGPVRSQGRKEKGEDRGPPLGGGRKFSRISGRKIWGEKNPVGRVQGGLMKTRVKGLEGGGNTRSRQREGQRACLEGKQKREHGKSGGGAWGGRPCCKTFFVEGKLKVSGK